MHAYVILIMNVINHTTTSREIQSVLTFSLKAAEQSLAESQASVVEKLRDSRKKRIKRIDEMYKVKLKELDMRSTEMCNDNSALLQQFVSKAKKNCKLAMEMTVEATKEVSEVLKI